MPLYQGIIGGGSGPTPGPTPTPTDLEPVLLWTNPTTTMVTETVTLDLTEYAGVLIESQSYMGSGGSGSRLYVKKGERLSAGRNNANDSSGGGARAVTVTDNGVIFEECYFTADKNNAAIVPTKIFGVKEYVVEPVGPISEVITFGSTGGQSVNLNSGTVTKLEGNITVDTEHTHYTSGVLTAKVDFSCKLYTDGVLSEKTYTIGENIGTTAVSVNKTLII